jgi:hypothetical protein
MNWLWEQPLVIVLVGVGTLAVLGSAWALTGRRELLWALAAAAVLLGTGLVVERLVVTDREAIQQTLLKIARDVQSNNLRAVTQHIAQRAPQLRQKVTAEMPRYHFEECRITRVHLIEVDAQARPRTARVEFNVVASGSFREDGFELHDAQVPRWVCLYLVREEDGRWTVEDYEHAPPQQMLMERGHMPRP